MIRVGTLLYGFCGGEFYDNFENRFVEAVGADWVVVRGSETGKPQFAYLKNGPEELLPYTKRLVENE